MSPESLTDHSDEQVTVTLSREKAERLFKIIDAVEKVENWCLINKWIGKWVIIGGLTAIIFLSDAIDKIKNILPMFGKH